MNYRYFIYPLPKPPKFCARMHHGGAEAVLIITYLNLEIVAFMARVLKLFQA
jgi:hypothetical protein